MQNITKQIPFSARDQIQLGQEILAHERAAGHRKVLPGSISGRNNVVPTMGNDLIKALCGCQPITIGGLARVMGQDRLVVKNRMYHLKSMGRVRRTTSSRPILYEVCL